jgi:hypothetical protein
MNPVKSWDNLSKNGKIAVVAGVLAISILWYFHSKKANAAAAAAAATTSDASGTSDSSTVDGDSTDDSGFDDSSLDPSSDYISGYEDALSAYGSEDSLGAGEFGTTGTDTTTGAGATNSTGTPAPPVTINVSPDAPSSTTGGGAPSTPPATAHTVTPASSTSVGNLLLKGAILAPAGSRTTKNGYVTVGTGGGNYQYVPTSAAPKGYTIYHSVSSTKPVASAKGLGNGLWAVPVGTAEP